MREKELQLILTFSSTVQAMRMERIAKERKIPGRLIPVPREITAGCGLAFCAKPELESILHSMLLECDLKPEQMLTMMI